MNKVWLSVILGDGKNPRVRHILCDSSGTPCVFDTQLAAFDFWREEKAKFDIDPCFQGHENVWRVTPQVVKGDPDVELFGKLDSNEYTALKPRVLFILHSDTDSNPMWLT